MRRDALHTLHQKDLCCWEEREEGGRARRGEEEGQGREGEKERQRRKGGREREH